MKLCSTEMSDLVEWAHEAIAAKPPVCQYCDPNGHAQSDSAGDYCKSDVGHLTNLAREILSHVLEVAVIHLDDEDGEYCVTIADVADCIGKTQAQIAPAIQRLLHEGFVELLGSSNEVTPRPDDVLVPSPVGLRTERAFADLGEHQLRAEINKLTEGKAQNLTRSREV